MLGRAMMVLHYNPTNSISSGRLVALPFAPNSLSKKTVFCSDLSLIRFHNTFSSSSSRNDDDDGESRFSPEALYANEAMGVPRSVRLRTHRRQSLLSPIHLPRRRFSLSHRYFKCRSLLFHIHVQISIYTHLHINTHISDKLPDQSSIRVPKITTIFGLVGMLKLLSGNDLRQFSFVML